MNEKIDLSVILKGCPENKKNIFDGAKFGDHYVFDGESDCIFLEKMKQGEDCKPLYRLVACEEKMFFDEDRKSYTENILREVIANEDGFCWKWEDDDGKEHTVYVTKYIGKEG